METTLLPHYSNRLYFLYACFNHRTIEEQMVADTEDMFNHNGFLSFLESRAPYY